jgi:hypothetical protein
MILTPKPNSALKTLLCGALALFFAMPAPAQGKSDDVLLEMQQAFRKGDKKRLATLLPQARGHVLEPWAAYWELKARLGEASALEVQDFLTRYAGTYQEDRMRNDWLQLLGQRRDWTNFAAEHPNYRMSDDREVRCYALLVDHLKNPVLDARLSDEVRKNWYAQRDADDGCTSAAERLVGSKNLAPLDVWKKARMATEANRPRAARDAVQIVAPEAVGLVTDLNANPAKFLSTKYLALRTVRKEIITLALIKLATSDTDAAIEQLKGKWAPQLTAEERNWIWGVIGKQAANRLSDAAPGYYANVTRDTDLNDDMLAWKVRAALRQGQWPAVLEATRAMSEEGRADQAWAYWRARALLTGIPPAQRALLEAGTTTDAGAAPPRHRAEYQEARQLLESIASPRGFYEQLALEELGQRIPLPPKPAAPTAAEKEAARQNAGLAPRAVCDPHRPAPRGRAGMELQHQPAHQRRHERPGAAGRRRPGLPERSLGPLHQHQRTHQVVHRPGAAIPHAVSRRGGQAQPRNQPGPGLRLWPDPPGKPFHHGCPLARGRLGPDAGDAGHRQVDGQEDRPGELHARPDHRPRHQHRHRHRIPQAGSRRLRRLHAAGSRGLQRRAGTPAQLAQRPDDGSRNLGGERAFCRDPRLRQEGALQHHQLRCHPERPAAIAEGAVGDGGAARGGTGWVENADLP